MRLVASPAMKIGLAPSELAVRVVTGSNAGTPLASSLSVVQTRIRPIARRRPECFLRPADGSNCVSEFLTPCLLFVQSSVHKNYKTLLKL